MYRFTFFEMPRNCPSGTARRRPSVGRGSFSPRHLNRPRKEMPLNDSYKSAFRFGSKSSDNFLSSQCSELRLH
uniref:Uncharacterized protein n=1 Tax=Arundo donax TaxID=35708 RepID=A0A0A9GYV2_ARUDO